MWIILSLLHMSTHHNFFEKYNTFFAIIIGALLIGGAIILTKSTPKIQAPQGQQPAQQAPSDTPIAADVYKTLIADDRIVLGNKTSKNVVIEISDPSCPFCHFASGKNPDLVKQSGRNDYLSTEFGGTYVAPGIEFEKLSKSGDIAYVFSYGNGHGNGRLAAEALYCAHERDGFWPVHNKLMSGPGYTMVNDTVQNDRTKSATLGKFLASEIDEKFMTDCLTSAKYESRINRDIAENSKLQFAGTPHFVINGNVVRGAADFPSMKGFIK
jgi:protein-disulfide isomerase